MAEWPLVEGGSFSVSNKTIELDRPITRDDYLSGRAFGFSSAEPYPVDIEPGNVRLSKQFVPLKVNHSVAPRKDIPVNPEPHKRGIPLQPVDLISTTNNMQSKVDETHWTANWYAILVSAIFLLPQYSSLGANLRARNTRCGMVTLMSHLQMENLS